MATPEKTTAEKELLAVFRREAEEQLGEAEKALLKLERDPGDRNSLKTFFRSLHSMKGNAGCVGLSDLEGFIHRLESVLHPVRELEHVFYDELFPEVFHVLYGARDTAISGKELPPESHLERIAGLVARAPTKLGPKDQSLYRITLQYPGEPVPEAFDPGQVFQDLGDLGTPTQVQLDPESILPLDLLENPDALSVRYVVELESELSIDEVRDGCFVFDDMIKVQVEPIRQARVEEAEKDTDENGNKLGILRIEAAKVDGLLNMAGELSITNNRLRELILNGAGQAELLDAVGELDRHSRFMQEQILGARMIAIEALFRPFSRLVRELSTSMNKRIRLETEGDEVELDKTIVEHMREPLTHMIRNAIDHGIETPSDRETAGKLPEGVIRLKASQREGSIYLEVHDDGWGIDREKLRQKAIQTGLINENVTLSAQQIDQLIFESGLSTAAKVTNISGRGVGMDIVRKSIEQIRGEVRLENHPGKGVSFYIRLPLTLALMDGVVLREGERHFIAPLLSVEEAVHVPAGVLRRMAGQGVFISLRGEMLPMLRVGAAFEGNGTGLSEMSGICVVLRFEERHVGILVDEVVDQQQFVIKSLEENYQRVDGFTGATIIGDGTVALILDVPTLVRSVESKEITQQ